MRSLLRVASIGFSVAAAVIVGGCKPMAKPCGTMTMSAGALVHSAAVVRLDVYGAGARCRGSTIAPGAPPPTQSQTVSAGKSLTLDVPAGHHVLLLSAFGDVAATHLIGSACTETDVRADQPACFDLKLVEAPDGATPFPEFDFAGPIEDMAAPPGSDLAEVPLCSANPDNCPDGRYCAANGQCAPGCKVDLDCAATPATPRCLVAAHTCVQCLGNGDCGAGKLCSPSNTCVVGCDPLAPMCPSQQMCCSALCIDTTSDVNNCGSCGHGCSLANATAECTSSSCAVKSCNVGHTDCNAMASDGCECQDFGDANHGCCPTGGCEHSHATGFGQTFYDCYTAGTYNATTATDAATAYKPTGTVTVGGCATPGSQSAVCNSSSQDCTCFTYADGAGGAYVGRARKTMKMGSTPPQCKCAQGDSGDVTWN